VGVASRVADWSVGVPKRPQAASVRYFFATTCSNIAAPVSSTMQLASKALRDWCVL
jgi:hypothetical protein